MQPFRYHVFVCEQQKPDGLPCCGARGGRALADALRREVARAGLAAQVQVTTCGSLGLCERGPNLVVYPEGAWYSSVSVADVPEIVDSHFRHGNVVARLANREEAAVKREIEGNRDRYLAALRARDAAGVLPDELQQAIAQFRESRVLLTAVELDLFEAVGEGGKAPQIARRMGTDPRATEMLLNALAGMEMLVKQEGVFRNAPAAARYFTSASSDNARMAIMHQAGLWRTWSHLTDAVRTGRPAPAKPGDPAEWTQAFIAAMHKNAAGRAGHLVQAIGTEGVGRLLDVGGGSGAYSIAFAQASPGLHAEILDREQVVGIARRHIADAGLADRVTTRVGDLRRDDFGSGFDLVLLSAICHMLPPEENRDLIRRCRQALNGGGRLAIQDFILEPDKTLPKHAALFSLNMLVGTEAGASYSMVEYGAWLQEARFQEVRLVGLPGPASIMLATMPRD